MGNFIFKKKNITPRETAPNRSALGITYQILLAFLKGLWGVFLIGFFTCVAVGIAMIMYLISISDSKINYDINSLLKDVNLTSYVYVEDPETGEFIEDSQLHGTENREWVNLNQIPDALQNAFIAIEDKRFQEHSGVDWNRTIYAFINLFTGVSETKSGGSTITQQLIKNVTENDDVSISRKITEIFQALNLEKEYSKDQILEAYLNLINLGNGCYGVQAAAQSYFGKDVWDLSLLECAALAGITQNPSMYNPAYYPINNSIRRAQVLYDMYAQGYISQSEYLKNRNATLEINFKSVADSSAIAVMDWYTEMVFNDVVEDLMSKYNISKKLAQEKIYREGLNIYSAVDTTLQSICEDYYITNAESMLPYKTLQSGMIAIDYQGRILATVGRRGEKDSNLLFSFALDATRQPGSSIKPLAAFSTAIEYNLMDWSTILTDYPITMVDAATGEEYLYPRNSYSTFRGDITLQKALEISSNCCSVRAVQAIGMERIFNFVTQRFHISTLYKSYIGWNNTVLTDITYSALATGGTVLGVSALEMASAYSVFGNGGRYYEPYSYYYVTDSEGNVLLDNRITSQAYEQVIAEDTAGVMYRLLEAVVTGNEATGRYAKIGDWQIFGKTGTTNNFKDRWFIGGNPYCVGAVWVGYETAKYISGQHHAIFVWRDIMREYLKTKEKITFDLPDSIYELSYCTKTGCLASEHCESTDLGWYKLDTVSPTCSTCGNEGSLPTTPDIGEDIISPSDPPPLDILPTDFTR